MGELTKAQKSNVGASLFWSVFNQITAHFEEIDRQYLEMMRILLEQKRRLDTLCITVEHHRKILSKNDTTVNMWCISCRHEFELPRKEAEAQDYTVACPKCGSWALLKDKIPLEFSIRDIARISGFAESTVAQTLRENGFKRRGEHRLYNEETAQKVLALLEKKTPRKGGKNASKNHRDLNTDTDGVMNVDLIEFGRCVRKEATT